MVNDNKNETVNNPQDKVITEAPTNGETVISESTNSTSNNIEYVLNEIDKLLDEDNKNVKKFYAKLEEIVKLNPISLQDTSRIPEVIDRHITNEQLPIYGSGFKNFKKKQNKLHERELAKSKFKRVLAQNLQDILKHYNTYKPGLYAPVSYNKITKLYTRAKSELDSVSFEDDYLSEFREIKATFIRKANKILTISQAKRRKTCIVTASIIGGAAVIGTLLCGAIPTLEYSEYYPAYGYSDDEQTVLGANQEGRSMNALQVEGVKGLFLPVHYPMKDVKIPDLHGGKQVASIGYEAFKDKGIKSLTLGKYVSSIGPYAFADNDIEELDFNNSSVFQIGRGAFENNLKLTKVKGIDKTNYIGPTAFKNCKNLNTIDTLDSIIRIENQAFAQTNIRDMIIGDRAQYIAYDAFDNKTKLHYTGDCLNWGSIYDGDNKIEFDNFALRYETNGYYKTKNISKSSKIFTIEHADRKGYKFLGYYTSYNGSGTKVTDDHGVSVSSFFSSKYVNSSTYTMIYPQYEAINYKITFNSLGGSNVSERSYNADRPLDLTSVTPSRPGYYFKGWYDSKYYNHKVDSTSNYYNDMTLYAKWEERTYKVTADSLSRTVQARLHYNDPNKMDETKIWKPGSITLNNPTRSGYLFKGWYTDRNLTTKFDPNKIEASSIDLYVKWEAANSGGLYTSNCTQNNVASTRIRSSSKTMIYNVDNGNSLRFYSKAFNSYPYVYFTIYDSDDNVIYNTQKIQYNYYSSVYLGDVKSSTIKIVFTSSDYYDYTDIYYYFSGTKPANSMTFQLASSSIISVKYGKEYQIDYDEKIGKEFKGYYTRQNGMGTQLTDGSGKSLKVWDIDDDINAYGYYVTTDYKITYELPEGVTNPNSAKTTYKYGDIYSFQMPTRKGYTFNGWYIDGDTTTEPVVDLDGLYKDLNLVASFTPITANLQLNGLEGTKRTVIFDYQDPKIENSTVYLSNNDYLYRPEPINGKNYEWYKDKECTKIFNFSETLSNDLVLYAKESDFKNTTGYGTLSSVDKEHAIKMKIDSGTSITKKFVVERTGKYYIYSKILNSSSYYDRMILKVNNKTTNVNLVDTYIINSSFAGYQFSAKQGDIIEIVTSRYSNYNTMEFYFSDYMNCIAKIYSTSTLKVSYDSPFEIVPPVKPGYKFEGFFTQANGLGTKVIDENGKSISNSTYLEDKTLYANFSKVTYTITYSVDEKTTNPNTSLTTYNYGDTKILQDASKDGYNFLGWYDGKTSSAKKITSLQGCIGNLTLYPRFEGVKVDATLNGLVDVKYKITLKYPSTLGTDEEKMASVGESVDLPVSKNGKKVEWYLDEECTEKVSTSSIYGNTTLYAKEKPLFENGTGLKEITDYMNGTNKSLSTGSNTQLVCPDDLKITMYYKNGYSGYDYRTNLRVYNVTKGNTNLVNLDHDLSSYKSVTFTADKGDKLQFECRSRYYSNTCYFYFKVEANPQSVKAIAIPTQEIEYGAEFTLPVAYKPGHSFKGYYDSTGTKITDENGKSLLVSSFREATSLTAKYEKATYTIKYVLDSKYTNPNSTLVSYQYGQTDTIKDAVVDENHIFLGWYDNSKYLGEPITSLTGLDTSLTLYANIVENGSYVDVSGLERKEQKITFNYGLEKVENKTVTLAKNGSLIIPNILNSGYHAEWYFDKGFTKAFTGNNPAFGDYILYAKWVSNTNSNSMGVYTKENPKEFDVTYSTKYYFYTADVNGYVNLYYKTLYTGLVRIVAKRSNGSIIFSSGTFNNASFNDYKMATFKVNKGEEIKIEVDCYNSGYTSIIKTYFEQGTSFENSSCQYVLWGNVSGINLTNFEKEGYDFKGLFTSLNGQGTKVVDETGKSIVNYDAKYTKLYAYYVAKQA